MVKLSTIRKMITNEDPLLRFKLLVYLAKFLAPNYRFKWPQLEWWDDKKFNYFLDSYDETSGFNTDRRWMLYQLCRLVANVKGDTAECGVYQGAGSEIICRATQASTIDRMHFIFDSFEGLSEPDEQDGDYWTKGALSCGESYVEERLKRKGNIKLLKGFIPARFDEVSKREFCFVHIDVDLYQPTFDSMKFFYPRMKDGGIIVCDDFGFSSCPGATKAINEYLSDKPEQMLSLPDGGGFIIKSCATDDLF